ncbi:PepSY domain-containing protein [Teredinibacter sp. KSP-S5-2]|uniref:PepSY domain-containing protein n=1 Tax=Teredinibacter sp. KSP-S5-2 TaxID=3034506 RepID=UPI0029349704|nr:PepSY domain-containing protein [Teredinibacter sp. KSP-S5-2]WNO08653.1 PepSY domain-containing protein [Teredinibacter sp. KSP-S5-2]
MKKLAKPSMQWHNKLKWFAGACLFIWALSGALHPLMTWTGPKAVKFYPPKFGLSVEQATNIKQPLQDALATFPKSVVVKVLASENGAVIQATQSKYAARNYFSFDGNVMPKNFDVQHAAWLASYYTGHPQTDIGEIQFITEFSNEYPPVNRLLPVYRVSFPEQGNLVAFVYTETNALAGLTNGVKTKIQTVFRALHTWSWLDVWGFGRVLLVGLFMLSLIAMCVMGMALILAIPHRKIKDTKRRWHRIIAYVLWLPLLGWSASGFYHLLKAEYADNVSGIRLSHLAELKRFGSFPNENYFSEYANQPLNSISLVPGAESQTLLRLSYANQDKGQVSRVEKYQGRPSESGSRYLDFYSGNPVATSDKEQVQWLANGYTGYTSEQIEHVQIVTRFGPEYDFRNKRLPVWMVQYGDEFGTRVFVDPVTGVLVDQSRNVDRMESWSFSVLHKWNFLNGITGRQWRDILIVSTIFLSCFLAAVGLLIGRRKQRKQEAVIVAEELAS